MGFPCTPNERHLLYAGQTSDWRLHQRLWRGLTQTCRQLRSEFLSKQATYDVNIKILDLERYIRFVDLQGRPQPASEMQGYIVLHVVGRPLNYYGPTDHDIYSMLMLLRSSPHLKIRWHESWQASLLRAWNKIAVEEFILSSKFLEYVATSATEVWITFSSIVQVPGRSYEANYNYINMVEIQLSPEIEKGLKCSIDSGYHEDSVLAWLEELGATPDYLFRIWPGLKSMGWPRREARDCPCGLPYVWPDALEYFDFDQYLHHGSQSSTSFEFSFD